MRRKKALTRAVMLLATLAVSMEIGVMSNQAPKPSLKVTLSTVPDVKYTSSNVPLKVRFQNIGDQPIKVLDYFGEVKVLPVFLGFDIKRDDGTSVFIPGAGKISPSKDRMKYIELKKDAQFDVQVNLAELVPSGSKLNAGGYHVSVTYHNQYGEGCFKGQITSNTIKIQLATTP